uniref:RING-type domain-containing protein n=1 Tax=Strigamia maritima TaxID=126957 RepID=T1J7D6_STRMM
MVFIKREFTMMARDCNGTYWPRRVTFATISPTPRVPAQENEALEGRERPDTAVTQQPVTQTAILTHLAVEQEEQNIQNDALNDVQSSGSSKLCILCSENEINTVFGPCGHMVSCWGCSDRVFEGCDKSVGCIQIIISMTRCSLMCRHFDLDQACIFSQSMSPSRYLT